MIVTELYNGQGLGNQLACYVTTRVIALDNGFEFGIKSPDKFKGSDFMELDFGHEVTGGEIQYEGGPPISLPDTIINYYREREIRHPNGSDIRIDDQLLDEIQDNTKLDGVLQSENKIIHRKNEIKQWLKIKSDKDCYDFSDENICIINFRGGEYVADKDFFLPLEYWTNAINRMLNINPNFRFIVITDDVHVASNFFPNFEVYHFDISKDFTIIKNAYYLILSNSSFPYFATLLSDNIKFILAPKYWGRYNISDGYWHCGYNIFRNHTYIDRNDNLYTYDECITEFNTYMNVHSNYWK